MKAQATTMLARLLLVRSPYFLVRGLHVIPLFTVTDVVRTLIGTEHLDSPHGPLEPKEISVISPFREQVWKLRLALRKLGLGGVDVGNVEALQGAEK
jgi:hypothetical protein